MTNPELVAAWAELRDMAAEAGCLRAVEDIDLLLWDAEMPWWPWPETG